MKVTKFRAQKSGRHLVQIKSDAVVEKKIIQIQFDNIFRESGCPSVRSEAIFFGDGKNVPKSQKMKDYQARVLAN